MVKRVQLLTHNMTTCVSQLKLIIDEIADKKQLPAIKHTSMSLRYMEFDHEKPNEKLHKTVHISPHEKTDFKFS